MDDKKKGGLFTGRNIILMVLVLCVIVSGILLIREQMEKQRQLAAQEQLRQLALQEQQERQKQLEAQTTEAVTETEPEETQPPYVSPIDFEALWKENPDTVGWITIPDTQIDYPIVYSEDNEKYLHEDFYGNESVYGTIYLDSDNCDRNFNNWNGV